MSIPADCYFTSHLTVYPCKKCSEDDVVFTFKEEVYLTEAKITSTALLPGLDTLHSAFPFKNKKSLSQNFIHCQLLPQKRQLHFLFCQGSCLMVNSVVASGVLGYRQAKDRLF